VRIHNSLTGEVEDLVPLRDGEVRMYSCGPTVYKRPHVGNYRAFVTADLLCRALEHEGLRVRQVMNITDVGHLTEDDAADASGEDRIQREAARRQLDPWAIAREVEAEFHEDLRALAVRRADGYPRATEYVPQMIEMIGKLLESGHAYEVEGNVYFDVKSFPPYGRLSGNTLEKLESGASGRVEERGDKRHPHDFALWKRDPRHLMQWDAPWGRGFPGWHIECSAMSRSLLGDRIDVHTGGLDNKFPHHECEIAQTESVTGLPFVRYWVHCGWLVIGGRKMAKREGRLYTLPELAEMGFAGRDVRLYLLKQHYRAPLPFEEGLLDEARRVRERLQNFVAFEMRERPEGPETPSIAEAVRTARTRFGEALADDLNTSAALAAAHELMAEVNRVGATAADASSALAFMEEFDSVFGVLEGRSETLDEAPEVAELLARREAARRDRDFALADRLRDELRARGIEVVDTPQGPRTRRT